MFFTLEDYKKIYEWISRNSIKDTEFNEALTPLDETDTITLVLNGANVKVSLKDLIDQLFLMGVSDFLNITDKFGEKNITLDLAIELIPYKSRKLGQVITFLDNNNKWKVYLFKGELTQWDLLNLWEDILDIESHTINSILPDEEDLTKTLPDDKGNSYLSFKDREYNPEDFSGLGRVILRKNIMEVEDPIYGKVKRNVLYQDVINKENTIYEIRYDFDLNGQEITIPEGCVLDFQGGSLSNGTIAGENTMLKSDMRNIFKAISIKGIWNITDIYSSWFDFDSTEGFNNATNFNNIINLSNESINNNIYINGSYWTDVPESGGALRLKSNTNLYINGTICINPNNYEKYRLIIVPSAVNVHIYNGKLVGDVETHTGTTGEWGYGVQFLSAVNCSIHNTEICLMWGDGIDINGHSNSLDDICNRISIDNCYIHNCRRQGISVEHCQNSIIQNCRIEDIGKPKATSPFSAIDIEPFDGRICNNVKVCNCITSGCYGPMIQGATNTNIHFYNLKINGPVASTLINGNCTFENCEITDVVSVDGRGDSNVKFINCTLPMTAFTSINAYVDKCRFTVENSTEFWMNNYSKIITCNKIEREQEKDKVFDISINNSTFQLYNEIFNKQVGFSDITDSYDNYKVDITNCNINISHKEINLTNCFNLYNCNIFASILYLEAKTSNSMRIYNCNITVVKKDAIPIIFRRVYNETIKGSDIYDIKNLTVNNVFSTVFTVENGHDFSDVSITLDGYRRHVDFLTQNTEFETFKAFSSYKIRVIEERKIPKASNEDPTLTYSDQGETYYNTTTRRYRLWQGSYWIGLDGKTDDLKKGPTESRPTLLNNAVDIGYMYYDTSLNKPIFYKGSGKWIDATGADV